VSEPDLVIPPHPALQAYRSRNRRWMRIYAAVIALLVLVGFVAVRLAYARGEINNVDRASAPAPPPLPSAAPASSVSLKWRSDDHPAAGNPYSDGVVVSYDLHSVNGRDAVTGAVRWHYRRSNQTLCSVVQQDRTTIAIYNRHGHCDEVTGFVTATGKPKWYRTLVDNGMSVVASAPNVVLIVADHSVHVIDNAGGLDRWLFSPGENCTIDRALAGSLGVLISYQCGQTRRLALRDLIGGGQKWNITLNDVQVPIAAHSFLATISPATGMITTYDPAKGTAGDQLPTAASSAAINALPRAQSAVERSGPGQAMEFVRLGTDSYALAAKNKISWSAPATGMVWQFSDELVAAPTANGVTLYRVSDGHAQQTISVPDTTNVTAYPVGAGLLLAGANTRMYQ
jgi:hypothetical protein